MFGLICIFNRNVFVKAELHIKWLNRTVINANQKHDLTLENTVFSLFSLRLNRFRTAKFTKNFKFPIADSDIKLFFNLVNAVAVFVSRQL